MPDFPEIGASVDPYRITRELGRGPLGVTYLATSLEDGTAVALKVMVPPSPLDPDTAVTLTRELRSLDRAGSGGILVPTYHGDIEGRYLLVETFFSAGSLQDQLDRSGPLPRDAVLGVGVHVARALHDAHTAGVIHGAVKPTNVFPIARGGVLTPALADFGTILRSRVWRTPAGFDAEYADGFVAPELLGTRPGVRVDRRADVYSLGCLLFALLTGRSPYDGPPPATPTEIPQLPVVDATDEAINALLARALQPDPAYRWESVDEVGRRLGELGRAEPSTAAPAAGTASTATAAPAAVLEEDSADDAAEDAAEDPGTVAAGTPGARVPTIDGTAAHGPRGRPGRRTMLVVAIAIAAVAIIVVSVLHHRHQTPQASGSPGTGTRSLPKPSVTAHPAYRAVAFSVEKPRRAAGASIQVDRGSGWQAADSDKVTMTTTMGGRRACVRVRLVDGDRAGHAVRTCGTSRAPVLRMAPIGGCTIGTTTYTSCYQLRLRGFESGTLQVNSSAPDSSGATQNYTDEVEIDENGTGVDPARFGASVSQTVSISVAGIEREFTIG